MTLSLLRYYIHNWHCLLSRKIFGTNHRADLTPEVVSHMSVNTLSQQRRAMEDAYFDSDWVFLCSRCSLYCPLPLHAHPRLDSTTTRSTNTHSRIPFRLPAIHGFNIAVWLRLVALSGLFKIKNYLRVIFNDIWYGWTYWSQRNLIQRLMLLSNQ